LQKIALHINPGVFCTLQPRNKHYELSKHLGNVLAVISDMKLYNCHEYNKFEGFENNSNINGDWNIRNSWEGQNAVLDLANGKLHVVDSITSSPHARINYLLPKHLPANQTYRIKFDLEHIIGDQNWQIGIVSSNTDSTYESNFSFFSGSTGHNEITFRPTGPIWRIRFLHLPVGQNMEFYLDNFSIENLSLDSNTIAMADIVSATDYYPFGAPMPGRSFQSGGYRFGFNGKENENEVSGDGNTMTAEFWEYDSRLGRRWNMDPVVYAWQSLYACFNNNPIFFIDPSGDEPTPDGKPIEKSKSPTPWKVGLGQSSLSLLLKEVLITGNRSNLNKSSSFFNKIGRKMDGMINFGILIVGQVSGDINYARKALQGMTIKTITLEIMDMIGGLSRKEAKSPFNPDKRSLTDQRNQTEKPTPTNSGPVEGLGAPDQDQVERINKEISDSIHKAKKVETIHYFGINSGIKPDSVVDYENGKRVGKRSDSK